MITHTEKFLFQQAHHLCRARWLAVVLGIALALLARHYQANPNTVKVYWILLALTAGLNLIACILYQHYFSRSPHGQRYLAILKLWVAFHTLSDLGTIIAVIHFTGGMHSPGLYLLLTYVGAMTLTYSRPVPVIIFTTLTVVLISALFTAYAYGVLTPAPVFRLPSVARHSTIIITVSIDGLLILMAVLALGQSHHLYRLWQQAESNASLLSRLHEFSHRGLEQDNIAATVAYLSRKTQELLQADSVYTLLWQKRETYLNFVAVYPPDIHPQHAIEHFSLPTRPLNKSCNALHTILQNTTSPQQIDLKAQPTLLPPPLQNTLKGYQAALLIPIRIPGSTNLLGVTLLGYRERPKTYPGHQIQVQYTAEMLSNLFYHALTLHTQAQQLDRLQALATEAVALTRNLRSETLAVQILEVAMTLFAADGAMLLPCQGIGIAPTLLASWFASGEAALFAPDVMQHSDDFRKFFESTAPETALQIPDVTKEEVFLSSTTRRLCQEHGIASLSAFRLPAPRQGAGILLLCWRNTMVLSPEEIAVGRLFATHAGTTLYNAYLYNLLRREARTDALTNLPNRRAIDEVLKQELKRAIRYRHPLSIAMVDLNTFKQINDRAGHQNGDRALKIFANLLTENLRETDFVGRYGGDEFLIILPETSRENAQLVLEKLSQTVAHHRWDFLPSDLPLTFAYGIATYPEDSDTAEQLVAIADKRLYLHKPS